MRTHFTKVSLESPGGDLTVEGPIPEDDPAIDKTDFAISFAILQGPRVFLGQAESITSRGWTAEIKAPGLTQDQKAIGVGVALYRRKVEDPPGAQAFEMITWTEEVSVK